ncbi:tyrosine-type recombinase/integrase [Edwardsiella piscicida]|uniref:tyrosine-type recombinase/integrase n=1 Tax=Edwardsiella piscicida TaxID=1263550 RepID=UPI00290FCD1C|nr:tyrosine-type recombinase/integrase [Edwardsiella piscicida]
MSIRTNKEDVALPLYYFLKRMSANHYSHLSGTALRDALRQALNDELGEGERQDWYYQGLAMEARQMQRRGIKEILQRDIVGTIAKAADGGFDGISSAHGVMEDKADKATNDGQRTERLQSDSASECLTRANSVPTFAKLMNAFITEKQTREGLREATIKSYQTATKAYSEAFTALGVGELSFGKISRQNVLQAQQWMIDTKGWKPASINTYSRAVKTMIGWANLTYPEAALLSPDKLMLKESKENAGKSIPPDIIVNTLSGIAADNTKTGILRYWLTCLLAITGMRIGELASLAKSDFCFDGVTDTHYINLTQDNGRVLKTPNAVRKIPLTDGAYGFNLKAFLAWLDGLDVLKVPTSYRAWVSRYHKAKGQSYTPHSYRHALATAMMNAGVPESHAAIILGHAKGEGISYGLYASGEIELAVLRDALEKAFRSASDKDG